jgi:hypothetical protein
MASPFVDGVMNPASTLLIAALVVAAMGATASLDQLVKQLRARHRIGVIAYAAYSRAADFHTGIPYYAPIVVGWVVLIPAAVIAGLTEGATGSRAIALGAMLAGLLMHVLVTGLRAAPILLSQRKLSADDEPALTRLFDRSAYWHRVRTIIDVATLGASIWALVETWGQT